MNSGELVLALTGALFWAAIAIAALAFVVLVVVPAIWHAACYAGFSAFADAEEKRTAKQIGREQAETRERIRAALNTQSEGEA